MIEIAATLLCVMVAIAGGASAASIVGFFIGGDE
jgi:hypothetical protein